MSSKRDLSESYDLLERKIVRPLERIDGVASVSLDGVNPKEVRINLRVADLEAHGVDVRNVARAIANANFDLSAGVLRSGERRLLESVVSCRLYPSASNLDPPGVWLRALGDRPVRPEPTAAR